MRISLFRDCKSNTPETREFELETLLNETVKHHADKLRVKCWSPALYGQGKTRLNANVETITAFVLDLDGITDEELNELDALASRFEHGWHTSYSHGTKAGNRYRYIFPLAKPVPGTDWKRIWPAFMRLFHAPEGADKKAGDAARLYLRPTTGCQSGTHPGPRLSVADAPGTLAGTLPGPEVKEIKVSRDRLEKLAKSWKRSRAENKAFLGECLLRACLGEPYAAPGTRDNTAWALAEGLAEEWPGLDPEQVATHFDRSSSLMGEDAPDMVDKLARAVQARLAILTDAQRALAGTLQPGEEYLKSEDVPEDISGRWVIQFRTGWTFFNGKTYSRMYAKEEVLNAAEIHLAKAGTLGIQLFEPGLDGAPKRKPVVDLVAQYGSLADDVIYDMTATRSTFDKTSRRLIISTCPPRDLDPGFNLSVDRWLKAFAGDSYEDLVTWLENYADLHRPACALVLTGPKGVGKSQFAEQLARIHTDQGPVKIDDAFGTDTSNQEILRCPLTLADEGLPRDSRGFLRTQEIRSFISSENRTLKRKYLPEVPIKGCPRLVITANNENVLYTGETLSQEDIQALTDRFYHIKVSDAARPIIEQHILEWRETDAIAKHVLYLIENRKQPSTKRFILAPRSDNMLFRNMNVSSGLRAQLLQWCVGYLKDSRRRNMNGVFVADGELWIRAEAVVLFWGQYVNSPAPDENSLSRAIRPLTGDRKYRKGGWVRPVSSQALKDWAATTDKASDEEIDSWLREENDNVRRISV